VVPSQEEIDAEHTRAKMMGGEFKFRPEEVGYFDPRLTNHDDNGMSVAYGRTTYKHLRHFLEAVDSSLTTLPSYMVRAHLWKCLRGDALTWYNSQLAPGGKNYVRIGRGLDNWKQLLQEKFKRTPGEIEDELSTMRYTRQDFIANKSITAFAIAVARNLQDYGYNVTGNASGPSVDERKWISSIWSRLDAEFKLTLQDPNLTEGLRFDQFVRVIDARAKVFREQLITRQTAQATSNRYTGPNSTQPKRFTPTHMAPSATGQYSANPGNAHKPWSTSASGSTNPNTSATTGGTGLKPAPTSQGPAQNYSKYTPYTRTGDARLQANKAGQYSRPQRAFMATEHNGNEDKHQDERPVEEAYMVSGNDAYAPQYSQPEAMAQGSGGGWDDANYNATADDYGQWAAQGQWQPTEEQDEQRATEQHYEVVNFAKLAMSKPEFVGFERGYNNPRRVCLVCHKEFSTGNKLHAHLRETGHRTHASKDGKASGVSKNTWASHQL
jgi:hypothetical protein